MGDRTYVTLTVQKEHAAAVAEIYETVVDEGDYISVDPEMWSLGFEEVNYGNLHDLEKLQELGIAFDSAWNGGHEYGSGCLTGRFTSEGEFTENQVYSNSRNPEMGNLRRILEENPDPLVRLEKLTEEINGHYDKITSLPWVNQGDYGKRYRARQLVENPT